MNDTNTTTEILEARACLVAAQALPASVANEDEVLSCMRALRRAMYRARKAASQGS